MHRLHIVKQLDAFTLRIDAQLERRVTGIYGPSGSGKTTLLDVVAGLVTPDDGRIVLAGEAVYDRGAGLDVPVRKRRVGYVFQDGALFEHLSVRDNLLYGRRDGAGPTLGQVVEVLELGEVLTRQAALLSGGEKRRVALGRALLSAPRVLLLDEPLTGLDRRLAGKTLAYIRKVLDAFALPALYVSHSYSDVILLCEEVVVLSRGAIAHQGPPKELICAAGLDPDHTALKNIFTAEVTQVDTETGTVRCRVGEATLTVLGHADAQAAQVTLVAPARDIMLAAGRPVGLSARNVLAGTVTDVHRVGTHCVVVVDVGIALMAEVTQQAVAELQVAPGMPIHVVIKASSIHCIDG